MLGRIEMHCLVQGSGKISVRVERRDRYSGVQVETHHDIKSRVLDRQILVLGEIYVKC